MTIVCVLQYLYILPTRKVEKAADNYARAIASPDGDLDQRTLFKATRTAFLDSMSSEVVWKIPLIGQFTYEELKAKQLAYGLDLSGGMSVVLQVDLRDLIRTLANNTKDRDFESALEKANQNLRSAQSDYVTLFAQAYQEQVGAEAKLAPLFASNPSLREQITFETTNSEVISIIRTKADETVDLTYKRLKERIDELGVVQPNVSLDAARDLIIVELPGISNPERARRFLQATAKLEFWDVYRVTDENFTDKFLRADKKMARLKEGGEIDSTLLAEEEVQTRIDTTYEYKYDSTGTVYDSVEVYNEVAVNNDPLLNRGPLLSLLDINNPQTGLMPYSVLGLADRNKKEAITKMLQRPEIRSEFPNDMVFMWSRKSVKDYQTKEETDRYELYGIKKQKGSDKPPLEGDRVTDASPNPDPQTGEIQVSLRMDSKGAKIWGEMTSRASKEGNRPIAIVLDNEVESAPNVQNPILNGNSSITGNYTLAEATDLSKILQIGKLPAKTKIIQEALVGPSLGQQNINASITSLLIGFGLVLIFMILYYGGAGIFSIVALLMNLFFIFGALASYGTVLTLPGIAGIVLTIGMAVDANVIIYERVREELRAGKTLMSSISDGFKHSYSAIIDANVTTILTAFVLAYFGLGPIKGFAVVLIIGVLSSLFTAVLIGRMMIDWWTGKDRDLNFWTGFSKNAFANMNIDWLGKRKVAYVISGVIILAGIGSMLTRSFELGVDFKGGYSYTIQFNESDNADATAIRASLGKAFGATPVVKAVSTENTYSVTTSYLINDDSDAADSLVMLKLHEGINEVVGGTLALKDFKDPDSQTIHVMSSSKVGPTIADDIKTSAIYATIFALLLIFLYIFIRFNKWQYSLGAVAALFHDTLIVLGIFSLFHGVLPFSLEIDQAFIAAILTVIGYSINDTVVVFDRIREFMNDYTNKSKEEIINMAINSTVSRTVITSLTTLFVVAILLFFGGSSIRGFAFALFIGIVVGTYSSIYVATPIMSDLTGEIEAKEKKKKSFSRATNAR